MSYLLTLIFLAVCGAFGWLISNSITSVDLVFAEQTVSINFFVALVLMLVGSYIIIKLLKLCVILWNSPELFSRNSRLRKGRKAQNLLRRGLEEMIAGHYDQAERQLIRGANLTKELEQPAVIYYEVAAICADRQNALERRDSYLLEARKHSRQSGGSTLLNEAELALNNREYAKAEKFLLKLQQSEGYNAKVNLLLDEAYAGQQKWTEAWQQLPRLQTSLSDRDFTAKRRRYGIEALKLLGQGEDFTALDNFWRKLPNELRTDSELILVFADAAIKLGRSDVAEQTLLNQIRATNDLTLIQAYSQLQGVNGQQQLENLNQWEEKHRDNPVFMLAKAQAAYRAQDLELALALMEEVIQVTPSQQAYLLWAQILESAGQGEAALQAYRRGVAPEVVQGTLLPPSADE